jgi:putative transcriptional regulator
MPIIYKINVVKALKNNNISTYYIRQHNLLSQSTLSKLNKSDTSITVNNLSVLCKLLKCQPGDILEYIPDD